jgi:pyruvate,orthophosphate dikinase
MARHYVYDFDEASGAGRELLGGKGAGLAEMTQLGVPVPAGFTIRSEEHTSELQSLLPR